MKKLLSILICMSMISALVCVPVSATVTPIFFDDFSKDVNYFTAPTYDAKKDGTPDFLDLSVSDGKLWANKSESCTGNFGAFTIPDTAIKAEQYTGGDKLVIEFDFYTNEGSASYIYMYINKSAKSVGFSYGDVTSYNNTEGNTAIPYTILSGKYTVVYDRSAGTATVYPPDGCPLAPKTLASIPNNDNKLNLEFLMIDKGNAANDESFDYIAVYPLADSFSAELSDVSATGATLKTNMPIKTTDAALKIGENNVSIAKTANTINTYDLTFAQPLSGGSYKLSGTVYEFGAETSTAVDINFNYAFKFEKAEELYFENIDEALAEGESEIFVSSTHSTWGKAGYYTGVYNRVDGKLKVTKGGSKNYVYFVIPASEIKDSNAEKLVIEWDIAINSAAPRNMLSIDSANYIGNSNTDTKSMELPTGKHYAIYDSTANTMAYYYPGGTEPLTGITNDVAAGNFKVEFGCTAFNGGYNLYDYIAVYPLNETFDGSAENATAEAVTLKTNMPLDLTKSTFKVGGVLATAVATDNTYNEYTITFGEVISKGDYTLEVSAVPLGSTEAQTKSISFNCASDPLKAGYYDDFAEASDKTYFDATGTANRMQKMITTAGKLEITKETSSNWAEFIIPASKINAARTEADKFIIQWNTTWKSAMDSQRIGINGSTWDGVWYGHTSEELKEASEGTYTVIYDRANNSASYYYPGCTEPIAIAGIPAATAAEGFDVQLQTITYGGSVVYDYITVYPVEGDFEYSISDVTEKSALLTTSLPIDITTAVIKLGGIDCAVKVLPTEPNKYILTPATALTVGNEYAVSVDTLKSIDGTVLTPAAHAAVVPVAGKTEITGVEVITDVNGRKVAKITGTNNVVGANPFVVIGEYNTEAKSLAGVICGESYIPYNGAIEAVADGITWSASASGLTYKGFAFESASSLKTVK